MLLERPGELVTREEFRDRIWTHTVVDFDHGINKAINKIREALGDSATHPRFVETVARRGYRFLADVVPIDARSPQLAPTIRSLAVLPLEDLSGDSFAGLFRRRHDGRADHEPRADQRLARDLQDLGDELQERPQAPAGNRAGARRGSRRRGHGPALGRARSDRRAIDRGADRQAHLGKELRGGFPRHDRAAAPGGAQHRRAGEGHLEPARTGASRKRKADRSLGL